MKKLFCALLCSAFSILGHANCHSEYMKASQLRSYRNQALVVVGSFVAGGPMLYTTSTIVTALAGSGYLSGLLVVWPKAAAAKNNFDKVVTAVNSAKNGKASEELETIIEKSFNKADVSMDEEKSEKAKKLLIDGFDNGIFCPVVKITSKGKEKRAVFTRNAIVHYLSNGLKELN